MKNHALLLLSLLSVATPACVVTTTAPRDVGSISSDGSVYLGWHLLNRDNKTNGGNDVETYDVGAQHGGFSAIRIHTDRPISLAEVLVIFANGERWAAPAPATMNANDWTAPLPFPSPQRPIHSIVITGRSTSSLLARVEVHGTR